MSSNSVDMINYYIIKMVDDEQEFLESDENNLSKALDDARESNRILKDLIVVVNQQIKESKNFNT